MRRILWKISLALLLLALIAGAGLGWLLWRSAELGAAYGAKRLASGVFVAGRSPESVLAEELGFLPRLHYTIDRDARTLTAWTAPRHRKTAVYREGFGVALAHDGDVVRLQAQAQPHLLARQAARAEAPWPMGDAPSGRALPGGVDQAALDGALDQIFEDRNPLRPRRTRAVVVVYDGEIVAERYAEGYGAAQRFPAWSVAKSVLHALYGVAVRDGKLDVNDPAPVPGWDDPTDPRREITIDMLLRKVSGLRYNEFAVVPPTDLTAMLFLEPEAARHAKLAPLDHPPGEKWAYSSATTNLLSWILRQAYGDEAYHALPHAELFDKIGMRDAIVEADPTETYVFSSFLYATARDFARFGLLYANDGVWLGERILPEGWVEYARTPSPVVAHYGAHWWLPTKSHRDSAARRGLTLPEDAFYAQGFEGQQIYVIPSRKLVVVHLGLAYFAMVPNFDFLVDVLAAMPE